VSSVIFTRGIVTGLGAAAGTLAVAALLGTAPIASADNNGSEIDWSTLASPAATFPELTYTNVYELALGNTMDTWTTVFTGTGLPTTTEVTTTLPTGETEFGSLDQFVSDFLTSATHGVADQSIYEAFVSTAGGVTTDTFLPLESVFSSF
jgi:hypothetical protein